MSRQRDSQVDPDDAVALWRESRPVPREAVTVKCELITPMYGGGVKAGEVDCAMPIRASALRGQLRFWWRLLDRAANGDRASKDVFEDECAIWGGISAKGARASQVTVRVDCEPIDHTQLIPARPPNVPGYGLILDRDKPRPKLLSQGYEFELTLEFRREEAKDQVVDALRWWAAFGGVGARTRRGFGAVVADLPGVNGEDAQTAGGRVTVRPAAANAMDAWHEAVHTLRNFRQARAEGGGRGPGRSKWPEADTIRRLAGKNAPATGPARPWAHEPVHPVNGVYPRAAFGLPIVFHFKDRGDPDGNTLEPAGHWDRMASPLILRPYFDGTDWRPMALLLPGWADRIGVNVELTRATASGARRAVAGSRAAAWPNSGREELARQIDPMKDRGDDVLTAFMQYFGETKRRRNRR